MNERDRRVADLLEQADELCLERRGEPLPGGELAWCSSCGRVSLVVSDDDDGECAQCSGEDFDASDVERIVRSARADERRKCAAWVQGVAAELTAGALRQVLEKVAAAIGGEE